MWPLLFLLCLILIALALLGIAIKMFLKKGGTFTKTCASCSCKSPTGRHEDCEYYELHHGSEKK